MKKSLLLVGGAILASVVMTGCAGVGTNNGAVTLSGAGMNLYSEMSANAMLPQYAAQDAVVVKRDVKATAELKSIFTAFNFGDASYETLKAEALKQAPGATDLTDVKMDYKQSCICGINTVVVTMTATADQVQQVIVFFTVAGNSSDL